MSFKNEIRQTILAYNFRIERKPPQFEVVFTRNFETKIGIFKVKLDNIYTDMSQLPKAYLIGIPKKLDNVRLPHLNADKSICYLDPETTNLHPIYAKEAIATCIHLIEKIVTLWSSCNYKEDIGTEFTSYWEPEHSSFIMTTEPIGIAANFKRIGLDNKEIFETIIAKDIDEAKQWAKSRGAEFILTSHLAIVITIRKNLYVPHETSWPPKSFNDFVSWLQEIDKEALQNLIHKIVNNIKKDRYIFIVLRNGDEIVGIRILLSSSAKKMFERIKGIKKRKKGQSLFKLKEIIQALNGNYFIENYSRIRVDDVSPDFLFQRNSPKAISLKGKKIALIGCGTIGGYSAHALIQCGAGSGGGSMHLFDDDILTSGNLGRHILGIKYLMELKSDALKHYLQEQGLPVKVYSHPNKFKQSDLDKQWDIIIDVTGNESFSLLLAYWYRTVPISQSSKIIHGWIDAYGKAVRILKDDKTGGCYGCLFTYQNKKIENRFPLFGKKDVPEHNRQFKRKCGKTYMPFNSQPSLAAAGMIQTMALSVIKNTDLTFYQQVFSNDVREYKSQKLTAISNCPICQK